MLREPLIASEPSASELTLANKSEDAVGVPAVGIIDDRYGAESLDMFAAFIEKLSHFLAEGPRSEEEVASELRIEKAQAKAWLKRATVAEQVEKLTKPVRYALRKQHSLCWGMNNTPLRRA